MKVYVLIWWFYEEDSNLVNSFEGVFSTYEEAMNKKNEFDPRKTQEVVTTAEAERREYLHGGYGDPSYYEIRECVV